MSQQKNAVWYNRAHGEWHAAYLQQASKFFWGDKVSTFSGACQWVRQEDAKPHIIQDSEGCVHTSRVLALNARTNFWKEILGAPDHHAISVGEFIHVFADRSPTLKRMCQTS